MEARPSNAGSRLIPGKLLSGDGSAQEALATAHWLSNLPVLPPATATWMRPASSGPAQVIHAAVRECRCANRASSGLQAFFTVTS